MRNKVHSRLSRLPQPDVLRVRSLLIVCGLSQVEILFRRCFMQVKAINLRHQLRVIVLPRILSMLQHHWYSTMRLLRRSRFREQQRVYSIVYCQLVIQLLLTQYLVVESCFLELLLGLILRHNAVLFVKSNIHCLLVDTAFPSLHLG